MSYLPVLLNFPPRCITINEKLYCSWYLKCIKFSIIYHFLIYEPSQTYLCKRYRYIERYISNVTIILDSDWISPIGSTILNDYITPIFFSRKLFLSSTPSLTLILEEAHPSRVFRSGWHESFDLVFWLSSNVNQPVIVVIHFFSLEGCLSNVYQLACEGTKL